MLVKNPFDRSKKLPVFEGDKEIILSGYPVVREPLSLSQPDWNWRRWKTTQKRTDVDFTLNVPFGSSLVQKEITEKKTSADRNYSES